MSVSKRKPRAVLGDNPLSQGIFSKTETVSIPTSIAAEAKVEEPENQDTKINTLDSRLKIQESRFLGKQEKEAVNLRLPITLNDWLNDLLRNGKRRHGAKIPKEIWVQAALELFRVLPVDWESIEDEEQLQTTLKNLESSLNNIDSFKDSSKSI
jgi:hypothetical protein